MKTPVLKLLTVAALSLGSIGAAKAATVNAVAHKVTSVNSDNTFSTASYHAHTGYNAYVGPLSDPVASQNQVFAFYLPTLVSGESFSSFTLSLNSDYPTNIQITDIYGLGTSASITPAGTPYYEGTNDTTPGVTKLQSAFLENTVIDVTRPGGIITSNNFSTYINSLYTGGAPSNTYVLLRLNHQVPGVTGDTAYLNSFSTEAINGVNGDLPAGYNATTGVFTQDPATTVWAVPYISYSVVPEPSTYAFVGVGLLGMILLHRRMRRA